MGKHSRQVGVEGLELFEVGQHLTLAEKIQAVAPRARTSDPSTSKEAAASMREEAQAQRAQLLACLVAHPTGLCADRLDEALGWRDSRAGRRCPELVASGDAVLCEGKEIVVKGVKYHVPELRQQTRSGRWGFLVMASVHLDPSWRV